MFMCVISACSEDLKAQLAAAQKQVLTAERAEATQRQQAKDLAATNARLEASLAIAREQMVTLKVYVTCWRV